VSFAAGHASAHFGRTIGSEKVCRQSFGILDVGIPAAVNRQKQRNTHSSSLSFGRHMAASLKKDCHGLQC
jgi:hypothetical protein